MRRSLSLLTAALVVAGLAACSSSSPAPSAAACPAPASGSTSDSVKVSGAFKQTPTVKFDTPLKAKDVQRTVVTKGKGTAVKPGETVGVALAAYYGSNGKQIAAEGFGDKSAIIVPVDEKKYLPGFVSAVECLPVGSRSVVTATAEQAFGTAYSQLNLKKDDSVVLLADLVNIAPTKADGAAVAPTAGFPTVKLAKSGEPTITVPKTDPPTETKVAVLKQGNGDTVQANDTVTLQYKGALWRNGQVFDSSWSRGQALVNPASQFVAGFTKAIVGQKVGSQVIAIIPPADGYGAKGNGEIKGTDTMVFVIDILGTAR